MLKCDPSCGGPAQCRRTTRSVVHPGLVAFAGVRSPRRVSWNRRCWVWLGGVVVESAGACLFSRARAREPPPFAVRCVLFSVDRGVGRFSSRNWNCRSFCGASPGTPASDARQRRPPATPASDAATRPTPQAMPGFVPLGPVNSHGTFRSYLPRNTSVRRFRALPASFAVLHLLVLSAAPPRVWPRPFFKGRVSFGDARGRGERFAFVGCFHLAWFVWSVVGVLWLRSRARARGTCRQTRGGRNSARAVFSVLGLARRGAPWRTFG